MQLHSESLVSIDNDVFKKHLVTKVNWLFLLQSFSNPRKGNHLTNNRFFNQNLVKESARGSKELSLNSTNPIDHKVPTDLCDIVLR